MHSDPELARAVEVLTRTLTGQRLSGQMELMRNAAESITEHVRDFVVKPIQQRIDSMDEFCAVLMARVDEMRAVLPANESEI